MVPIILLVLAVFIQVNSQLVAQAQVASTCDPPCGAGECCTRVAMAMVSRKRCAGDLCPIFPSGELYRHLCQPIKQQGETCLLHNTQQEWCDCAAGLACTHSDTAALNTFFGVCQ